MAPSSCSLHSGLLRWLANGHGQCGFTRILAKRPGGTSRQLLHEEDHDAHEEGHAEVPGYGGTDVSCRIALRRSRDLWCRCDQPVLRFGTWQDGRAVAQRRRRPCERSGKRRRSVGCHRCGYLRSGSGTRLSNHRITTALCGRISSTLEVEGLRPSHARSYLDAAGPTIPIWSRREELRPVTVVDGASPLVARPERSLFTCI